MISLTALTGNMPVNITFRTQLLGGVYEFCRDSKLRFFADSLNLVELIVLLARYQEEGVSLCPRVYITSDIEKLTKMLPGGERYRIGSGPADAQGIKSALKKCAPLATGDWMIYIADGEQSIEFGVFKGESNPVSVPVDSILLVPENDFVAVRVSQIATDCVEVNCNNGSQHYIFLNHRKEDSPPPLQYLDDLVNAITLGVEEDVKESARSYLTRLLYDSLRQSHGCIIAVSAGDVAPDFLAKDGVILESPINFSELVKEVVARRLDTSNIDSKGVLLKGMLNSDGIIIFNRSGHLLGFNCFVKSDNEEQVVGGARKRAFATLGKSVGRELQAAFMQSQDGWSDFKG